MMTSNPGENGMTPISIAQETCKKCGLCSEVCPNKIIKKNENKEMFFLPGQAGSVFQVRPVHGCLPNKINNRWRIILFQRFLRPAGTAVLRRRFFQSYSFTKGNQKLFRQTGFQGSIGKSRRSNFIRPSRLSPDKNRTHRCAKSTADKGRLAAY